MTGSEGIARLGFRDGMESSRRMKRGAVDDGAGDAATAPTRSPWRSWALLLGSRS